MKLRCRFLFATRLIVCVAFLQVLCDDRVFYGLNKVTDILDVALID
jgi:hypothetical protein